ncbi:NifX-associated nitrogen fixation protein [Cyanobacterium sp. Dongsha4]|uniref:NifX-associated nitrogen fixation protein n=1 Tax=Cyanobacterium sp. DS4 TaxID=2878255 RepID=UPI002E80F305|nr:NifX-associated nitrogen fixation protein [Cyanobacterium sp. Dongsha4]WVL00193.1 NifX-associated nitrogen fixation protein [Cyanobacterium sp. Dongsha4]
MTTTITQPESTTNIIKDSLFLTELVLQVRAQDHYGVYRSWSDELVLANFVVSKEKKRQISVEGDVDSTTQLRILCFYRAIASCIEKKTGKLCQVVIDLSHEGFGWVIVWTGRLIVVTRTLRDAQRFGYASLEKMATEGEKLVDSGVGAIAQFPETANA